MAITRMAVDNLPPIHAASVDDAGEVFHLILMFLCDPCIYNLLVSWAGLIVCDVMNNNEDDFGDSGTYS